MVKQKFGEKVTGFDIPVLNEREIRAAAGLWFLVMFISIAIVIATWKFTMLKFATTVFLADFLIRVFVSPRFSPSLILGRLVVRNQVPEYVGAVQKKFAWSIGIVMAATMFVTLVILNLHSPINGLICFTCLIFLFCESAFGICLGCKVYPLIYGKKARYCPGEICDPKSKHPIQMTSAVQLGVMVAFFALAGVLGYGLKDYFSQTPQLIMGMEQPNSLRKAPF